VAHFSDRSRTALLGCDAQLITVASDVISIFDFAVTCGHRSNDEQAATWAKGRDEYGNVVDPSEVVTWARPGQSLHNREPSQAFDFAPWPIDWKDVERFAMIAGAFLYVAKVRGIELEWGGHWKGKKCDRPHIQLRQTRP